MKLKRIVRSGARDLPPSADRYEPPKPAVVETHASGKVLSVLTHAGVEVTCKVVGVRALPEGPIYEVVAVGNKKVKELRDAGVPVDDDTVCHKFMVFPWQVV